MKETNLFNMILLPEHTYVLNTLYEKKPSLLDRQQNNGAPANVVVTRGRPSAAPSQTLFSPATATNRPASNQTTFSTQDESSVYFDKWINDYTINWHSTFVNSIQPNNLIQSLHQLGTIRIILQLLQIRFRPAKGIISRNLFRLLKIENFD